MVYWLACIWYLIPPFHRGRRVPGHWPESRFVTSGHGPVSCLSSADEFRPPPDKVFHESPLKPTSSEQAKSSDDKSSMGVKFVIGRLLRRNFRPMSVYPPIAPSTFRWFRLPTGHGPATLPCDAVEPPTTRQIGDSPTFNRIFIRVWSVGYRKHWTLISGSSPDDRSGSFQNLI